MQSMMLNRIILWLLLAFACLLPASALTVTAPENCVWEIFSIGYDSAPAEVTDLGNRTEAPTSNYDIAPIYRTAAETRSTQAERPPFGPNAEFKAAEGATPLADGSFSISNWKGYPDFLPKPTGPMRLLEGDEYAAARAQANEANAALRQQYDLTGMEIHEIQPVKFGGSPTDISNKIPLPTSVHRSEVTPWWNALQRSIEGGN